MHISFCRDKRLDGQRGCFFRGIYSSLEEDNMLGVMDLAFEALIMSSDNTNTKKGPAKVIDVSMTFEEGDDTYMDFDT
jgi:hypothetical protein